MEKENQTRKKFFQNTTLASSINGGKSRNIEKLQRDPTNEVIEPDAMMTTYARLITTAAAAALNGDYYDRQPLM